MNNEEEGALQKNTKHYLDLFAFGTAIIIIVLGVGLICYFRNTVSIKSNDTYEAAYSESYENLVSEYWENGYEQGQEHSRVTNHVNITVGNLQTEYNELEVLEIRSIGYITSDSDDNEENIDSVFEVEMSGEYCVNMALAEYIIDNSSNTILVRLPKPYLSDLKFKQENIKKLYLKKESGLLFFDNGSYKEGEDFSKKQIDDCIRKIKEEMRENSSQDNEQQAKKSAEFIIENLITNLNPDVTDLKVKFEYVELDDSNENQ